MKSPVFSAFVCNALLLPLIVLGATASAQQQAGADGKDFLIMKSGQEHWVDYKGDGAQYGIKEAFIFGDPSKPGLYIVRLKFPPGVMSTPHTHPETRVCSVIKGTWWTGTGEKFDPEGTTPIEAGGLMVHPAGKAHFDGARYGETVVECKGIGPTGKTPIDPTKPGFARVAK